jgi:hypothetical protein
MTVAEFMADHERRVAALEERYGSLRYVYCEPRYSGGTPALRKKVYTSDGRVFANTETAARAMGIKRPATIRESIRVQGRSRRDGCRVAYEPFAGVQYGKERAA